MRPFLIVASLLFAPFVVGASLLVAVTASAHTDVTSVGDEAGIILAGDDGAFTNPPAPEPAPQVSLFVQLREPLMDLLGCAVTALVGFLAMWIRQQAKNSKFAGVIAQGTEIVETYVAKAEVELKPMFKSFLADGKIDALEAQQLKAKVTEIIKRDMPPALWGALSGALGPALDGWLSGKIEQAVEAQKHE